MRSELTRKLGRLGASDDRGGIARVTEKTELRNSRGQGVYEPNGYSRTSDGAFIVAGLKDNKVFFALIARAAVGAGCSPISSRGKPLGTVNTRRGLTHKAEYGCR